MKFKVFFLTIIIQKNKFSESNTNMLHERQINQAMDNIKERQSHYCSHL
ncbi:YrzI family protein [Bacillus cereus]|nr:YrzI family small protein [Bacillus cereus]PFW54918.1 YrzI family protein [Bacillus cereus]PGZ63927.1 YrzI family protein [Bacillus cereus]HDR4559898.1 YrzI family small protein [Bacillus luti]